MGKYQSKTQQKNIPQKESEKINIPVIHHNVIERKQELCRDHKYVPLNIQIEIAKSICKITIKIKGKENNVYGTGFFMNISNTLHYLITNYHVINENTKDEYIEIEIYNNKKMELNLNNRNIKYFPRPKDITLIEIKNNDDIYNDIQFLNYDKNYTNGYNMYKDIDVFSIHHPYGKPATSGSGKITNLNGYEFDHNIPTDIDSSGCPILLLNDEINLIQVIGIQKEINISKDINCGTFIGEIFNDNFNDDKNYIIGEINIEDDEVNENIRIINSYEESVRNHKWEINEEEKNEEEIKKCEIRINDELISFNYFYKFPEKGKYIIKYSFKNDIIKTNYIFHECSSLINLNISNFNTEKIKNMNCMFCFCSSLTNLNLSNFNTRNTTNMNNMFSECSSLINLNLSNFNTQNVTDMSYMFYKCSSLTNLNLSNFNTKNVTNMNYMFFKCSSLTNIDLSNFNTKNVTDMDSMFRYCSSLTNLNLSNFNTKNVINMSWMFSHCTSLTILNISNFNTQNVNDMSKMFHYCNSLTNLDLSNFNTQNVTDISMMFYKCSSLIKLNLSNFNTQNINNMDSMFSGCSSLEKDNIIAKDIKILNLIK